MKKMAQKYSTVKPSPWAQLLRKLHNTKKEGEASLCNTWPSSSSSPPSLSLSLIFISIFLTTLSLFLSYGLLLWQLRHLCKFPPEQFHFLYPPIHDHLLLWPLILRRRNNPKHRVRRFIGSYCRANRVGCAQIQVTPASPAPYFTSPCFSLFLLCNPTWVEPSWASRLSCASQLFQRE